MSGNPEIRIKILSWRACWKLLTTHAFVKGLLWWNLITFYHNFFSFLNIGSRAQTDTMSCMFFYISLFYILHTNVNFEFAFMKYLISAIVPPMSTVWCVRLILTSCLLFPTTTLFKHIISKINTRRLISTTRYSNFSNKFPHHLFGKRQTTYIYSTFPFNSKNPEENQSINVLFISYFCFNLQAAESRYPGASFL